MALPISSGPVTNPLTVPLASSTDVSSSVRWGVGVRRLHSGRDRWWYTCQQSHTELPRLSDDDTRFQPLLLQEGKWYGGGRAYSLDDLADTQRLPYRYEELFKA